MIDTPETTLLNARRYRRADRDAAGLWIDRRTRFGNPYRVGPDDPRHEAIEEYRAWFERRVLYGPRFAEALDWLRGNKLLCWCKPKACHGDVILDYLRTTPPTPILPSQMTGSCNEHYPRTDVPGYLYRVVKAGLLLPVGQAAEPIVVGIGRLLRCERVEYMPRSTKLPGSGPVKAWVHLIDETSGEPTRSLVISLWHKGPDANATRATLARLTPHPGQKPPRWVFRRE